MNEKLKTQLLIGLGAVIVIAFGFLLFTAQSAPGKYDDFAKCIKESGALFYGAFWCPHCQDQKHAFGTSAKYLPYIECSTPDSKGQLDVCKDAGIQAYPTWKFSDGSKQEGDMTLEKLAEKTSCALPE